MRTKIKIVILILALLVHAPGDIFAIGEYNGVWLGSVTDGEFTWESYFIVYQDNGDTIYVDDECFGSIQLLKSGSDWILPTAIYSGNCDVEYSSMSVTFQSQTQFTGWLDIKEGVLNYRLTFSFSKQSCQTLANGVPVQNLSSTLDSYRCFQMDLPTGTTDLTLTTGGGTGDCDLDVIYSRPQFDYYYSSEYYTNEYVSISSPASGTWYVFLYGWEPYSGVTLVATYQTIPIPEADIKANGSDGPVGLLSQDTLNIAVAVNSNGRSDNSDWWLAASTPLGLYFYTFSGWTANPQTTYQGPLFPLASFPVLNMPASVLPAGIYTFFFGVDTMIDGKITMENAYYDSVQVNVVK